MFAHSLTASARDLHPSMDAASPVARISICVSQSESVNIDTLFSQTLVFVLFGLDCLSCKLFKCPSQLHSIQSVMRQCCLPLGRTTRPGDTGQRKQSHHRLWPESEPNLLHSSEHCRRVARSPTWTSRESDCRGRCASSE